MLSAAYNRLENLTFKNIFSRKYFLETLAGDVAEARRLFSTGAQEQRYSAESRRLNYEAWAELESYQGDRLRAKEIYE